MLQVPIRLTGVNSRVSVTGIGTALSGKFLELLLGQPAGVLLGTNGAVEAGIIFGVTLEPAFSDVSTVRLRISHILNHWIHVGRRSAPVVGATVSSVAAATGLGAARDVVLMFMTSDAELAFGFS